MSMERVPLSSSQLATIDRAAACLACLAEAGPSTATEVARAIGLATSTTYRYLAALRSAALVWDLPGNRYGLGPLCLQLEASFRRVQTASYKPVISDLAAATGETVALLIPVDHRAICIDTVESSKPLRYAFSRGASKSMLRGASAKAMLPHLDLDVVERLMKDEPNFGADERTALLGELPGIRDRGYVTTCGEVDEGVWAVGVPVFDDSKRLQGSLSTIAPMSRASGREPFLVRATVEAAAQVREILG